MTLLSLWSLSLQRSQLTEAQSDDDLSSIIPPNPSIHICLPHREEVKKKGREQRKSGTNRKEGGGVLSEICTNYFLSTVSSESATVVSSEAVSTGTQRGVGVGVDS